MTAEAFGRIGFRWSLRGMYIVARRAGHGLRSDVALAPLQQAYLIAMNVRVLHIGWSKLLVVVAQRLARNIGECWSQWRPLDAVMAFCAQVDLAITGEFRWIEDTGDGGSTRSGPMRGFDAHVLGSGPMAGLA